MNTPKSVIAAVVLLIAGATALAADKPGRAEKNEARLAALLKGRAAGTPVNCIPGFQSDELEIIEGVALVYGRGDTIYVARPTPPRSLGWNDVVVINRFGGQLCNTDIARTIDRSNGFTTGVLFVDKFVPYKKQD
ncbi:MAG: hypothetical protein ABI859_04945 [Pseudomonadota bacterium]